jgi:integrase
MHREVFRPNLARPSLATTANLARGHGVGPAVESSSPDEPQLAALAEGCKQLGVDGAAPALPILVPKRSRDRGDRYRRRRAVLGATGLAEESVGHMVRRYVPLASARFGAPPRAGLTSVEGMMSESRLLDSTGRLRSPPSTPGQWAGCAPPNKGMRYPADPPTVEKIILVMREAGPGSYADRTRGLIAILRRAGLRISEALALTETDLDPKTGSMLVRAGRGGKRRMVGMDEWGWGHLARWTEHRVLLPIGPLFCILAGPTRGPRVARNGRAGRTTQARGPGRRAAAVRAAPATSRARDRDGTRRDPATDHPAPARTCTLRDHIGLPPRNRYPRDCRHGPSPSTARNARQRRPAAVTTPQHGRVTLGLPRRGARDPPPRPE